MEKRNVKISFHKAGNGRSAKITVPIPWLRKMGITEENRNVIFSFDEETKKLTIEKE